jgi:hypothetical protein
MFTQPLFKPYARLIAAIQAVTLACATSALSANQPPGQDAAQISIGEDLRNELLDKARQYMNDPATIASINQTLQTQQGEKILPVQVGGLADAIAASFQPVDSSGQNLATASSPSGLAIRIPKSSIQIDEKVQSVTADHDPAKPKHLLVHVQFAQMTVNVKNVEIGLSYTPLKPQPSATPGAPAPIAFQSLNVGKGQTPVTRNATVTATGPVLNLVVDLPPSGTNVKISHITLTTGPLTTKIAPESLDFDIGTDSKPIHISVPADKTKEILATVQDLVSSQIRQTVQSHDFHTQALIPLEKSLTQTVSDKFTGLSTTVYLPLRTENGAAQRDLELNRNDQLHSKTSAEDFSLSSSDSGQFKADFDTLVGNLNKEYSSYSAAMANIAALRAANSRTLAGKGAFSGRRAVPDAPDGNRFKEVLNAGYYFQKGQIGRFLDYVSKGMSARDQATLRHNYATDDAILQAARNGDENSYTRAAVILESRLKTLQDFLNPSHKFVTLNSSDKEWLQNVSSVYQGIDETAIVIRSSQNSTDLIHDVVGFTAQLRDFPNAMVPIVQCNPRTSASAQNSPTSLSLDFLNALSDALFQKDPDSFKNLIPGFKVLSAPHITPISSNQFDVSLTIENPSIALPFLHKPDPIVPNVTFEIDPGPSGTGIIIKPIKLNSAAEKFDITRFLIPIDGLFTFVFNPFSLTSNLIGQQAFANNKSSLTAEIPIAALKDLHTKISSVGYDSESRSFILNLKPGGGP